MKNDYARVEEAIRFIESAVDAQPSTDDIAAAVGISAVHLRRLFRRWAGVSPKRFLQYLTVAHARAMLDSSASVLDAALATGLSGASRLHDHFVTIEAVSPGEHKRAGEGMEISFGLHDSPFGEILVAQTSRGICGLAFCGSEGKQREIQRLQRRWPRATLREDSAATRAVAAQLNRHPQPSKPLSLLVSGTNFQVRIWEALLRIPAGKVCSYGQLAALAGSPGSARAVGSAVGANQVAWLIPCHRVIRSTGISGDYRWGALRKRAMLGWESAHSPAYVKSAAM